MMEMNRMLDSKRIHFTHTLESLELVSPIATLKRGYAIASDKSGDIIGSIANVEVNDQIDIKIADGEIKTKVISRSEKSLIKSSYKLK